MPRKNVVTNSNSWRREEPPQEPRFGLPSMETSGLQMAEWPTRAAPLRSLVSRSALLRSVHDTGQVTALACFLAKREKQNNQFLAVQPMPGLKNSVSLRREGKSFIIQTRLSPVGVAFDLCWQDRPAPCAPRPPLPSRITPIPARNSLCCTFGRLISCFSKHHQILSNNADSFQEINQTFLRLLRTL